MAGLEPACIAYHTFEWLGISRSRAIIIHSFSVYQFRHIEGTSSFRRVYQTNYLKIKERICPHGLLCCLLPSRTAVVRASRSNYPRVKSKAYHINHWNMQVQNEHCNRQKIRIPNLFRNILFPNHIYRRRNRRRRYEPTRKFSRLRWFLILCLLFSLF